MRLLRVSFFSFLILTMGWVCFKKPEKKQIPVSPTITTQDITSWDKITNKLDGNKFSDVGGVARIRAYLFYWQKAFADAAYSISGSYTGSLDPISVEMIQLFYPEYEKTQYIDPFSRKIANSLLRQIDHRFVKEESHIHPRKLFITKDSWQGAHPYDGLEVSSLLPWSLTKASEFRAPAPSTNKFFWLMQFAEMKQLMESASEIEKEKIAQLANTDWIDVANHYMEEHNVPVSKRLEVRCKLAMALLDSMIAFFDSKYTYLVQRPNMLDPTLKTLIPTPNHPSYPAGDSTAGSAAAVVLSYYFPENREKWEELAEKCGLCKIYAGLHFPIDHAMGKHLGQQIGHAVIDRPAH